jgi:hypothetical protein
MALTKEIQSQIDQKRFRRVLQPRRFTEGSLEAAFKSRSLAAACKAQCLECVGFDRKAITECAAYACPLWNVRPYQVKDGKPDGPKRQLSEGLRRYQEEQKARKAQ